VRKAFGHYDAITSMPDYIARYAADKARMAVPELIDNVKHNPYLKSPLSYNPLEELASDGISDRAVKELSKSRKLSRQFMQAADDPEKSRKLWAALDRTARKADIYNDASKKVRKAFLKHTPQDKGILGYLNKSLRTKLPKVHKGMGNLMSAAGPVAWTGEAVASAINPLDMYNRDENSRWYAQQGRYGDAIGEAIGFGPEDRKEWSDMWQDTKDSPLSRTYRLPWEGVKQFGKFMSYGSGAPQAGYLFSTPVTSSVNKGIKAMMNSSAPKLEATPAQKAENEAYWKQVAEEDNKNAKYEYGADRYR
jgi:hypothetical protein